MSKVIYEMLEREGKIGPNTRDVDGNVVPKPFQEYPKAVYIGAKTNFARGEPPKEGVDYVVVHSLRDEAQVTGALPAPHADDPLATERDALDAERAKMAKENEELEDLKRKMSEELAKIQAVREELSQPLTKPAKVSVGVATKQGSST